MSENVIQVIDKNGVIEIVEISESTPIKYSSTTENKYTSEQIINKVQDLENPNPITYPSSQAVYDYVNNIVYENADKNFRYTQNVPSDFWVINHNLDKYPSVSISDSAGTIVEGDVTYIDKNNITIKFSAPFSGFADFN